MFRIHRLISLTNLANRTRTKSEIQHSVLRYSRFYSKDTKDPKDKSCRAAIDKANLRKCKPINIEPSKGPKVAPIPPAGTCPKTICDRIPRKEEPCPEPPPPPKKRTGLLIAAAILAATAALVALYCFGVFDKKSDKPVRRGDKKRKPKRVIVKDPAKASEIPNDVPYLLIGGGTASFSAFRAIKSADPTAKVLIISNEGFYPYMRPPLSKEMWFDNDEKSVKELNFKQWNGQRRNLYYEPEEFYTKCKQLMQSENGGVAVARGWAVSHLDLLNNIAFLDNGYQIHYEKCLIATGATPKTLGVFEAAVKNAPEIEDRLRLFRNIYDFQDVYDSFNDSKTVAIVGGGLLGSELACALARKSKDKQVYHIFRETGILNKLLPEYLSSWTTEKLKVEGVDVMSNTEIVSVQLGRDDLMLKLNNGKLLHVDFAIVAVGVEPNTKVAQKSGLEIDPDLGGFVCNTELQARTDLYIAGDCACFYDTQLGRRRIEHFDQAVVTGRLAGENMTSRPQPYTHQSMFWSDLGPDIGFEAIGIIDSSLPTVGVFAKTGNKGLVAGEGQDSCPPKNEEVAGEIGEEKTNQMEDYGKGVIFYLRDDIVVGVVLWNVFNRMSVARQVIKDGKKYDDLNEVAKLFSIHEE